MIFMFQWLLLFLVTLTPTIIGAPNKTPPLSPVNPSLRGHTDVFATSSNDFETFFYNQTLDHFNFKPESYATFQQRYIINSKWWGGASKNAPILVYLGAEGPIDDDVTVLGFLTENAPRFKALVVFLEHRFYGESNPFGLKGGSQSIEAMEESVKNKTIRGYFNSAQALADYAELLLHIKNKLHAHNSPIIVIGGSYGGMLASWFRLKYPHIALGALASSAPILYFDDLTPQDGYYSIVTKDFEEASENCYTTIKQSWNEIDRVASMPNGLAILSQKFNLCSPLNNAMELKNYLDSTYASAAQYNAPPRYPTTRICQGIDAASNDTDILDRVFAGVVAYQPNRPCYNVTPGVTQTSIGWQWQVCSEMVIPIGITSNVSMFPSSPYDAKEYDDDCDKMFGVMPRPHWATTYYGGQDIRMILSKFGSNIIFSNGLRDPYSSGGVLEDISENILAVKTTNGSHCLDILKSVETDPEWLVKQRKDEVKIISRWFRKYYQNLRLLKQ
ncbi:putative lysosomal Pro-Xaa carboxypeptidase [Helianthus annuus]|uniref:Lysosomal Pro-Xaa carboxypeptidase n=1 Tax=Helianthus annuus TaxID=4232 RepID=A0A251VRJ6_HELAN|nr:lysosomal Pro-X carboxypeptidase [Helianthus annuus]KAF5822720.1 putative lysosomal Pro-Xaa carboxypeptidase [Helianthus annuus]KAJ0627520.1 putative lysosomal Pro-Xaa carboxypeptidase [Helianthus annuus]KAJ0783825.1 putative lysosomal Pro-Xaa carboxypeptidase [Helianthus annuus]KAJ0948724.1 putative lysosomal Pro-Xaa carboxypeptidase [Helianthus annuus]KAJ0957595.1 putative lysosomal Pro-Xaa carboxypeptidase [Helianthus annuus]